MTAVTAAPGGLPAPGYWRRLACLAYEGVLLFGVVMVAGLVYSPLMPRRPAAGGTLGLQAFLFVVLGVYFVVFWTRGGQTLAMKTWRIRLVTLDGAAVSVPRALARYLLAWMWFVPALVAVRLAGVHGAPATAATVATGVFGYAALAWVRRDRRYWHDVACRTQLIDWPVGGAR